MNNIEDKTEKKCTGCGACFAICPQNAINYNINNEGFFIAQVEEKDCIHCGICQKVCYRFGDIEGKKLEEGKVYACKTKNEDVLNTTTSGGIAYEIAKYGVNNGYYVLGTIYDYVENKAKMIMTNDECDLEKIKGSKYLQSDTSVAFSSFLKKALENIDNKFIVFGTPCQIAGIDCLIKKNKIKNQVIKIDLFCHGVPSYLVWNKYLEENKINNLDDCNFRSKDFGWHQFCLKLNNSKKVISGKCSFYKIFFDNMFLNFSCYDCEFRKEKSIADIRLGDFWGPRFYRDTKGISAALLLTDKGSELFNKIDNRIIVIEECNIEECLNSQSIKKYDTLELNNEYKGKFEKNNSLNKVINSYRKKMKFKKRVKLYLRDWLDVFSPFLKYNIKKAFYKIFKKGNNDE